MSRAEIIMRKSQRECRLICGAVTKLQVGKGWLWGCDGKGGGEKAEGQHRQPCCKGFQCSVGRVGRVMSRAAGQVLADGVKT